MAIRRPPVPAIWALPIQHTGIAGPVRRAVKLQSRPYNASKDDVPGLSHVAIGTLPGSVSHTLGLPLDDRRQFAVPDVAEYLPDVLELARCSKVVGGHERQVSDALRTGLKTRLCTAEVTALECSRCVCPALQGLEKYRRLVPALFKDPIIRALDVRISAIGNHDALLQAVEK